MVGNMLSDSSFRQGVVFSCQARRQVSPMSHDQPRASGTLPVACMRQLTPTERQIVDLLMQWQWVSDEQLAQHIYGCILDASVRDALEKHIDHLRMKVRLYEHDIGRIMRYGYILLPQVLPDRKATES